MSTPALAGQPVARAPSRPDLASKGMIMRHDGGPMLGIKPAGPYELVTEFTMPHGTVTVVIDRIRGLMEIFAEHEPDALDWELACGLLDRMGLAGQLPRGEYLKGVDVWTIQLGKIRRAG